MQDTLPSFTISRLAALILSATLIHLCHIKCIHRSQELEHLWEAVILPTFL